MQDITRQILTDRLRHVEVAIKATEDRIAGYRRALATDEKVLSGHVAMRDALKADLEAAGE